MGSMEETRIKLKALLIKVQQEKIELKEIPSVMKRSNFLKINRKFKWLGFMAMFCLVFRQAGELFGRDEVKISSFQIY